MIRFFLRLDFFTCYPLRPTPLPAHAGDEVGHGEAEKHEAEEGGDGGAGRADLPEAIELGPRQGWEPARETTEGSP